MWGRVVELMTAVWLLLSPFVFHAQQDGSILWGDTAVAMSIACLSSLSFWDRLRYAHFAILPIAIALVLVGRFATPPPAIAAQQNHIFVGFFLMMIAIIPNNASQPPLGWQQTITVEDL